MDVEGLIRTGLQGLYLVYGPQNLELCLIPSHNRKEVSRSSLKSQDMVMSRLCLAGNGSTQGCGLPRTELQEKKWGFCLQALTTRILSCVGMPRFLLAEDVWHTVHAAGPKVRILSVLLSP